MEKPANVETWIPWDEIEESAQTQIANTASLPIIHDHVAIMPDCHFGMGATVGSVLATSGAVIPAAVGVDIGCGMIAVHTTLRAEQLPDTLEPLRHSIERSIPLGVAGHHKGSSVERDKRIVALGEQAVAGRVSPLAEKWRPQLGTLGSGNHFIEVCLDEHDDVWVVLHSGSRGIGHALAMTHIRTAQILHDAKGTELPDGDLAWLQEGTPHFDQYIRDLLWAQDYALANRDDMMDAVLKDLSFAVYRWNTPIEKERINCHHNFTQKEGDVWITRKGAIQMREGQRGVIPGSMGTCSYIVSGRGNAAAFESAPHGAGRRMSRRQARDSFTMEDADREMRGVEWRRSSALLDELPSAYKDIDTVMARSADLVEITHTLRQVVSVKGD